MSDSDVELYIAGNAWMDPYPYCKDITRKLWAIKPGPILWDGWDDFPFMELLGREGGPRPKPERTISGAPKGCHSNAAFAHKAAPRRFTVVTGFAFVEILWTRHSWLKDEEADEYVETTVAFSHYYGTEIKDKKLIKLFIKAHNYTED